MLKFASFDKAITAHLKVRYSIPYCKACGGVEKLGVPAKVSPLKPKAGLAPR
jgi:hypothetical protein